VCVYVCVGVIILHLDIDTINPETCFRSREDITELHGVRIEQTMCASGDFGE
jgi:hypothetical protein